MEHRPHPGTGRPLAGPTLSFHLKEEVGRLRSEPDWTAGRRAITLAKHDGLRVVLTALRAGAVLEEHVAAGALAVQGLEGRIRFEAGGETRTLGPGDLLVLEPGLAHRVRAEEESVFLLTVAQPGDR